MIRRSAERIVTRAEHMKGGEGVVIGTQLINSPEELFGKGRLYNHVRLEKNCEIGWHVHTGDGEFYYILSGEGQYSDNGVMTTVKAGDFTLTPEGEGHSLKNVSDEPLELIALILYA